MGVKSRVRRIRNNGLKQKSRIVNRDYIIAQRYPESSTFLNVEKLKKTGRSLKEDAEENKEKSLPRKFLNIGKIDVKK